MEGLSFGLDPAFREGAYHLAGALLMAGAGLLVLIWAATSRYFEALLILGFVAILAYAAHG